MSQFGRAAIPLAAANNAYARRGTEQVRRYLADSWLKLGHYSLFGFFVFSED